MKRKIRLNPHVEVHGHHALEWSFHFPLQAGLRIEAEFDIAFPGEKVPGPAREALASANLATTRLSLADAASDVRRISLQCLADTIWACEHCRGDENSAQDMAQSAPKFFLHRAKEYWGVALFSRLGLMLQSDLKSCFKPMREALSVFDVMAGVDWEAYYKNKRHMLSALRSAFRLVAMRLEWETLARRRRGAEAPATVGNMMSSQSIVADTSEVMLSLDLMLHQVRSLSELSLVLVCKTIAELQEISMDLKRRCEEARTLLAERNGGAEGGDGARELIERTLLRAEHEVEWLAKWAKMIMEWREKCGLKPLADVAMDAAAATEYFERVLELKRQHYQVFDLRPNLQPNDSRIDFWIGGVAAGVSALFAFVATMAITLWLHGGTALTFGETGLIAIATFAGFNVIIYVLKDRMKEWLKVNAKRFLGLATGRWDGICTFRVPGPIAGTVVEKKVAELQRRAWWSRSRDKWHFHLWESYRILPEAATLQASIVKQTWRLPLDEVLDTLDDSRHVLKMPTTDGIPQQIPVLKRVVFPFRTSISVLGLRGRQRELLDQARLGGIVVASGARLVDVE